MYFSFIAVNIIGYMRARRLAINCILTRTVNDAATARVCATYV